MKDRKSLNTAYKNFKKMKITKTNLLKEFRNAMPEIIFRTTKLDGE